MIPLLFCIASVATLLGFLHPEASTNNSPRTLTFAQRVSYQRAIEEVYWRHRLWPKENLNPKPPLDAAMSQVQLERKVTDYLHSTKTMQDHGQPITAEDLQAEMDRMAENTKQPEVLRELFDALGNDPFVVAECLARPLLSERLITNLAQEQREGRLALAKVGGKNQTRNVVLTDANYALPTISDAPSGCTPDSWTDMNTPNVHARRWLHTAVWTGSEMIIWGGANPMALNTGGRYNPTTDTWTATSTTNAPDARWRHTAVWTGSEMIVWGGIGTPHLLNTGGKYNPNTDSWTAINTISAPDARIDHTAVWTGSEMIIWGGIAGTNYFGTGGRYNPSTDSWTATSTTDAPNARAWHTAVWTSSEMIVFGGYASGISNTGGRYNTNTDSWTSTSITDAEARESHTAVWTGSEMIVWGGFTPPVVFSNTGGRYNPTADSWMATSIANGPTGRVDHTAVWTGSEMIVWGGTPDNSYNGVNTGGRYNPSTDSWTATSIANAPEARREHTAVWTGSEMLAWGGMGTRDLLKTGGRYCTQSGSPTPTPTVTATPTATTTPTSTPTPTATVSPTPTATARPSPTPRIAPTPRPRPTPPPRP